MKIRRSNQQNNPHRLLYQMLLIGFCFLLFITSCDLVEIPIFTPTPAPTQPTKIVKAAPLLSADGLGLDNYIENLPLQETEITFRVKTPGNTPTDQPVYLIIRDEVTGLALNSESYPLQPVEAGDGQEGSFYSITLKFPMGSLIKYRYERQTETVPVAEHTSDENPVRYRLYHVEGPGTVDDVISRWTDTSFVLPTGRIIGKATDADTGAPLPSLLVTAAGAQTLTSSDGTFLLEGLPEGVHNLVAIAMDGTYRTFQQGARVAPDSTTPASLSLHKSELVEAAFVVDLPDETPPIIPIRLAGSLFQLGNTFGEMSGGMSSISTNMPILTRLPDGRYLLKTLLPSGADIRYKYTLGDGFWNSEHSKDGDFVVRHIIVPEQSFYSLDIVDTWRSGGNAPITFDITAPLHTPPTDTVSIQFNPVFGWTTPIPMWSLGDNRWAYILYSPLNLPGDLQYRFCRNGQCNRADDVRTVGEIDPGFPISLGTEPQTVVDVIPDWSMLPEEPTLTEIITPTVSFGDNVVTGIELEAAYHPSFRALIPHSLGDIHSLSPDFVIVTPTWTYTRQSPPVLAPVLGSDASWFDVIDLVTQANNINGSTLIFPAPNFSQPVDEWWATASRDFSWWLVWFEQYTNFILHHADIAGQNGVEGIIIGGPWVNPALPSARLFDGSPSGVPADSEERWRGLLANVRARFPGKIFWALTMDQTVEPPAFMDSVDGIYLLWDAALTSEMDVPVENLQAEAGGILDTQIQPLQSRFGKLLYIAVSYPSAIGSTTGCALTITGDCYPIQDLTTMSPKIYDLSLNSQEQINAYSAVFNAIYERDWINGVIARGYYAPAKLIDPGLSSHGKKLDDLIKLWFRSTQ